MTPAELQELRDWLAVEVMGWNRTKEGTYYTETEKPLISDRWGTSENTLTWRPDDERTGQIWLLVERMRELGWYLRLQQWSDSYEVWFTTVSKSANHKIDTNPCLAICLAARAAMEGK